MRRVVITGVGAVSPCGATTEATWSSVVAGRSGIAAITRFDATAFATRIAGECRDFDIDLYWPKRKQREGDRFVHLAMGAAVQAIESSGFAPDESGLDRTGVFVGVGFCGLEGLERTAHTLFDQGPGRISPYFIPSVLANLAPGHISMRWGYRGPNYTITSACASGGHAIGEAFRWIARGDLDAALAGGAEGTITGLAVGGFNQMRALSTRNDDPRQASRPFDRGRDGFVMSEGAGLMVLEERQHALKRGAPILAEICGYGASSDAYHLTQPSGDGALRAMKSALSDGGIRVEDVDYVNAHGTSTQTGDAEEVRAVRGVFGDRSTLWMSSTKSTTGHLLGAAGGLEAVFCALALRDGIVPPTSNLREIDPLCEGVDLVPNDARQRSLRCVLSNSFGFGGTNVSLVFAGPDFAPQA